MIYCTEAVVIGGGPGGLCAALALARQGRKTALVTNRPVLGGNSSSEIRVWTRGATGGGNLYAEEMGIWGELKLRNLYLNTEANPVFWDNVLLEQVLLEENLELFLNTHVFDLKLDGKGTILSAIGVQMGTEKQIEFQGNFFIDATGDGTLGQLAKVTSTVGKEDRTAYDESFAPEKAEKGTFGNTIFFFTRKEDHPVIYRPPAYAYPMEQIKEMLGKGGRIVSEAMNGCDYWWFETGGLQDTIADAQDISFELKALVAGVWNYIKNSGKFQADYLTLAWEGNLPGKRESRRMVTERVLCQKNILEQTEFTDSAFYGGWYLDFHPSGGINTEEEYCTQIPVQVYPIPLSCLYSRQAKNLVFAGRNIGVSHVAFASTRIMNTCALSGQAAGTLTAVCLREKCAPWELSGELVRKIQDQLLDDDMLIPGVEYDRGRNLAVQARLEVSSEAGTQKGSADGYYSLEQGGFLVYPASAGSLKVMIRADEDTELCGQSYRSPLPSRAAYGKEEDASEHYRISIKKGQHWVSFPRETEEGFLTAVLESNPLLSVAISKEVQTGFLLGHKDSPVYRTPYVETEFPVYGKENLTNGAARPWNRPNLWMSGHEERPWIRLLWDKEVMVQEVLFFFNPDLNMELVSSRAETWDEHHKYVPRRSMPPQLVRSAELWAIGEDGSRQVIASLKENWQRRWQIRLREPIKLKGLELDILSTYGNGRGEVFEMRVYGK